MGVVGVAHGHLDAVGEEVVGLDVGLVVLEDGLELVDLWKVGMDMGYGFIEVVVVHVPLGCRQLLGEALRVSVRSLVCHRINTTLLSMLITVIK